MRRDAINIIIQKKKKKYTCTAIADRLRSRLGIYIDVCVRAFIRI
jgi:hypothetical protein